MSQLRQLASDKLEEIGGSQTRQLLGLSDQLLAKTGVLLIVDQITPPSGPVAKGVTPVVKARELALFIAVSDDGMVYAFNGHVDLGTGIRTSLAQIVAEELDLRMDQVHMVLGDTERAPNQGATIASATLQISAVPKRCALKTAQSLPATAAP